MTNYVLEMDESLIDFKEKKKAYTGPKASQRVKVNKVKHTKIDKGQRKIETLLKKKKSDLVTFTKDFNKVCLESGIDVDSQQLQLAIALSKSLHQSDQIEAENIQTNKFVSSQDKTNRIRKTLQEYGFKVSSTNIKPAVNRRGRTCRKSYKLLLISEEEKAQKINDRYAQVLFENPCKFFTKEELNCKIVENGLYYLATNISYECMKSGEIFYISEILGEISNMKSNLLKNWAEIPGRPSSPIEREDFTISLSDIECTQAELDTMLSGTLKAAKDICRMKIINDSSFTKQDDENVQSTNNFVLNIESSLDNSEVHTSNKSMLTNNNYSNSGTYGNNHPEVSLSRPRCTQSPDIFDNDDTTIIVDNVKAKCASENLVDNMPVLDLIGYENFELNRGTSQLSQNLTKRKTNDFMDLTDCVSVALQKFEDQFNSNSETTKEFQLKHDNMEITECVNPISLETDTHACDFIDLTQQVHNSLEISAMKPVAVEDNFSTLDLTQSSNSDDDLPAVDIGGTQKLSSDDTVVINYDDYFDIEPSQKKINLFGNENVKIEENEQGFSNHSSFSYHGNNLKNDPNTSNVSANNSGTASVDYVQDKSGDNDFIQSSDPRSETCYQNSCRENINNTSSIEYNGLGKRDNVSIDYDDICYDKDATINMYCLDEKFAGAFSKNENVSKTVPINEENFKNNVSSCNTSEHCDLSDQELNYSMVKSTGEILDLNNTLPTENFRDINKNKNMSNMKDNFNAYGFVSENYLLSVSGNYKETCDIQQQTETHITLSGSTCSSPVRAIIREDQISIQTPTNSEYVVKTENVTPMLDYGAMTSPERNKELEKFGLKPFKRKRAIQLLTHLYNQTHPTIEYCSEGSVLAKKFKPDCLNSPLTINERADKLRDIQVSDIDEDKNIYRQTKDIPDIRDIECSHEDWVFQKRENAKVHTCRVPLHIAFHNYVSCRRALRNAILRYEPINIDIIHKDLTSYGYKYNPKDLLKFLDKRCITVRTAENNGRNNKK